MVYISFACVGLRTVIGGVVIGVVVFHAGGSVVESDVGSVAWVVVVIGWVNALGMVTVYACVLLVGFGSATASELESLGLGLPMLVLLLWLGLLPSPGLCLCLSQSLFCIHALLLLCLGSLWR